MNDFSLFYLDHSFANAAKPRYRIRDKKNKGKKSFKTYEERKAKKHGMRW